MRFAVGDEVKPTSAWRDDPNRIPCGRVYRVARFGADGAVYVEGERCAFAEYVFEKAEAAE